MNGKILGSGVSADLLPYLEMPPATDMGPIEATVTLLSSQAIRFGDVSALVTAIGLVHGAFAALVVNATTPATEPEPVKLEPAVPIKKSITPEFLICLEDGKKFKSLKRHLMTHFNLTPDQYREKWGLPSDYPVVAPNYAAVRSQLAKDNGLGKKRA